MSLPELTGPTEIHEPTTQLLWVLILAFWAAVFVYVRRKTSKEEESP